MLKRLWWIKLWCIGVLTSLTLTTCQSGPKAEIDEPSPEKDLVTEGESAEPTFSPRGDRLLFVSRARKGHTRFQVYEKDLTNGTERRITFQNGQINSPLYHPKEEGIIYSSSTDELKEAVPQAQLPKPNTKLPEHYLEPFEIYSHAFKGLEIVRLTRNPGFDGEARFSQNGNLIYFTRIRNNRPELFVMNRDGNGLRALGEISKPATQLVEHAKMRAWVEWSDDFKATHLMIQFGKEKSREVRSGLKAIRTDLEFSRDGKWLLWAERGENGRYEIWGFDVKENCARPLLQASEDRRHPTLSPDGKWLTFTSWRKGRSRIAQLPFRGETGACVIDP